MGINKGIQLDLSKRKTLQKCLEEQLSLKEIAELLGYHSSTISREIRKYRVQTFKCTGENICYRCKNYKTCHLHHRCGDTLCFQRCVGCMKLKNCIKFAPIKCKIVNKYPFVCNACDRRSYCMLNQYKYDAIASDAKALEIRHDSRIGLNMSKDEYLNLNEILKNGSDKGQSIYHIVHANESINRCVKSIYNYINNNQVSVKRIDLPRAVTLKKRKKISKKYEYNENKNINRSGRTYADWLVYQAKNRTILFWQMDFLGAPKKSEQQILMLTLKQFEFAFFIPIKYLDESSIIEVFDILEQKLGNDFTKVFEAILTDRDCKFNCFKDIEVNSDGVIRTHVFFCDPARSNEKPNVENFNQQCRTTFKKKTCLSNITWEQCNTIASHYNSRFLNSIDGKRPVDLFIECFGENILHNLGLSIISANEVKLVNFKKY